MASRYDSRSKPSYRNSTRTSKLNLGITKFNEGTQRRDNYKQLSLQLTALGHRADAEDMMETVQELGELRARRATRDQHRNDYLTHTIYVTLDKAIEAYQHGKLNEKQFNALLYKSQHQLSNALHASTPEELDKKPFHKLRLTDIVTKEVMKQAAAVLAFTFALLSFDQVRLTGAAVSGATGGYDYYSLFGFLFLALATLLLLMRKEK